jgi:hypothetical protein
MTAGKNDSYNLKAANTAFNAVFIHKFQIILSIPEKYTEAVMFRPRATHYHINCSQAWNIVDSCKSVK